MRTFVLALCLVLVSFVQLNTAQIFPSRRSCTGQSECVFLNSCPQMIRLIQSGVPGNIQKVREAICGFSGRRSLVCCPTGDGGTPTEPGSSLVIGNSKRELLPQPGLCGRPRVGDKIFGGAPAPLGAYPWMAAMGYSEPRKKGLSYICTGSIINSRYILTAAHCVAQQDLGSKRLRAIHLGDWNITNSGKDCQQTRLGVNCINPAIISGFEEIIIHPLYETRGRSSDDIALIRLDQEIDFETTDASVEPICLPSEKLSIRSLIDQKKPIAAGWGLTEHSNYSHIMLRIDVPLVNHDQCKKRYSEYLEGDQICVGGDKGYDTCSGDSGGPLVIPESGGPPYTQIGIVSYGPFPCGLDQFPGVYTSVKRYMGWIRENLRP